VLQKGVFFSHTKVTVDEVILVLPRVPYPTINKIFLLLTTSSWAETVIPVGHVEIRSILVLKIIAIKLAKNSSTLSTLLYGEFKLVLHSAHNERTNAPMVTMTQLLAPHSVAPPQRGSEHDNHLHGSWGNVCVFLFCVCVVVFLGRLLGRVSHCRAFAR